MTTVIDDNNIDALNDLLAIARQKRDRDLYLQLLVLKSQSQHFQDTEHQQLIFDGIRSARIRLQLPEIPASSKISPGLSLKDLSKKIFQKTLNRDTVIKCTDITKSYRRGTFKLHIEDFQIQAGSITGLVGENGNGKSTLLKIMAGKLSTDKGSVVYPTLMERSTHWQSIKSKIGYLPQDIKSLPGKVKDSLRLNATIHGLRGKEIDFEIDYITTRLGIDHLNDFSWRELSGGYKLRFALASILLTKPAIMLLDEPLANLDILSQNILLNDLKGLSKSLENPIAIVISSQLLEEVEAIADDMLVISNGKAIYQGPTAGIAKDDDFKLFELKCPLNKFELKELLMELGLIKIDQTALSFIVTTPRQIGINELMAYFSARRVPVTSLADISNSTKRFFYKDNNS